MFLMIAFCGYSKGVSTIDTTQPVDVRFIRNALQAKDSLDIMIIERDSLVQLKAMYEKFVVKDSVLISSLDKNISLADRLIKNLEAQVANSEKQGSNKDLIIKEKDGIIKKKNRTIVKLWGTLAAAAGGMIYLLTK